MAHVLVVDDDIYVREGLAAVLAASGHAVTEAGSVAEARKLFAGDAPVFDLTLLDLWLPDGNGLEFLSFLAGAAPDLPVIVMSGGGPGRSLEQALAVADATGARASIIKPFQNAELMAKVDLILAGH